MAIGYVGPGGPAQEDVDAAVTAAVNSLLDGAPGALNTLNELAAALGDDENFAATVTAALAARVAKADYDANTVLAADTDDTPVAVSLAASQILGRKASGGIVAMTMAELREIIGSGRSDTTFLRGDGTWASAGDYAPTQKFKPGGFYYYSAPGAVIGTAANSSGQMMYVPLPIGNTPTLNLIGCEATTGGASGTARLGIYNSDQYGFPSTLLLDAGTVDTSTSGVKNITISQAIPSAGLYFLGIHIRTGTVTYRTTGASAIHTLGVSLATHRTIGLVAFYEDWTTSGNLPATATPSTTIGDSNPPRLHVRTA